MFFKRTREKLQTHGFNFRQCPLSSCSMWVASHHCHHIQKTIRVDLCIKHEIEWLDLPMNPTQYALQGVMGEDRGDCIRVKFDAEEMSKRARRKNPGVPAVDELKVAIILYFSRKQSQSFWPANSKLAWRRMGQIVLWMPPYTPNLQPIEISGRPEIITSRQKIHR